MSRKKKFFISVIVVSIIEIIVCSYIIYTINAHSSSVPSDGYYFPVVTPTSQGIINLGIFFFTPLVLLAYSIISLIEYFLKRK